MKKYIFAAVAALATSVCVAGETHFLQVNFNDESTSMVEYAFSQAPEATFDGSEVVIKAEELLGEEIIEVRYEMADVKSLTIRTEKSAVEHVADDVQSVCIYITDVDLTMTGLNGGVELSVFDTAGRLAAQTQADAEGKATISIASLVNGVYVASTPQHSFKFIKK